MATVNDLHAIRSRPVVAVSEDDTVLCAVQLMAKHRIGSVVVQSKDSITGIFTERDVLNRVVAPQKDPSEIRVREVMTTPVICCELSTRLTECQAIMAQKRVRHLPVMQDGEVVGMLSIGDLNARESEEQALTIRYLHEYLHGRV